MLTRELVLSICPRAPGANVDAFIASQEEAQIDSPLRGAMYLSQLAVETGYLCTLEENLNYSAERMVAVWPHRFPSVEVAAPYAHNPEKLANHVYCDRDGNGSEESGEGWKFRGRGIPMVTGYANYKPIGNALGLDLIAHPELLAQPDIAFRAGVFVWRTRRLNDYADQRDVKGARRAINGGLTDLVDCERVFDRVCEATGVLSLHVA